MAMRQSIWVQRFLVSGLLLVGSPMGVVWAEIVMKILVVNPSETETKEFTIHGTLPPEVKAEDVLDTDGLQVEYDSQAGTYILTGTVTLKPKQSLTKHVVLDDVWMIPDERFTAVRQELEAILGKLQGSAYEPQGRLFAESFKRRLVAIEASQQQPLINPEAHISLYRDNMKSLQSLDADMVSLRQLMVMAALQPANQSILPGSGGVREPAGSGLERGTLSIMTTWRLIFLILGLLGFVSLSFFLVWQRQLKLQLARQAAHEGVEASPEELFSNGHGEPSAEVPPPLQPRVQPKSPLSS